MRCEKGRVCRKWDDAVVLFYCVGRQLSFSHSDTRFSKKQIDCSLYSCAKAAFLKQTEKCWQISMQIRFSLISFGSGSREAQLYATKPKRPCPAPCCMNWICCLFLVVVVFKHQGNSCMCLGCCTCGVATYFRHW